jgi:signal transduction histidine kinase
MTTDRGFSFRDTVKGLAVGAVLIAVISGVIALLRPVVPPLGLTGLYLFAILPVAIHWRPWLAGIVSVLSYLTFAFFFALPLDSFRIANADEGTALAISIVISILIANVVSVFARRAQTRAGEAQLRAEEAEQAQKQLRRIADDQAALRRVATLVARGARPEQVFAVVTEEVGRRLDADVAALGRYEPDGTLTEINFWSATGDFGEAGRRWAVKGKNAVALVRDTGAPARIDSYADATGPTAGYVREQGMRSSVGAPVNVAGRLWGVMAVMSSTERPLPADTEERLSQFTEVLATAIANAQARTELTASRGRVIAAADAARRRLERDLHDGVQQRLVSLALNLRAAEDAVPDTLPGLRASLAHTAEGLKEALTDLQEIARGLHPAVLSKGGLGPALKALARRTALPVDVSVRLAPHIPENVEVAAYYVVAEALSNATKHSRATNAVVSVRTDAEALRIHVRDEGVGGADPHDGSGLVGLIDRVEALGGTIELVSPRGGGTSLSVTLPLNGPGPPEA